MSASTAIDWMMWRIDDKQRQDPPALNLIRAIQYFNEKYGQVPNRIEIPQAWENDLEAPVGITLTRSKSLRPGHLMLALDTSLDTNLPGKRQP